MLKNEFTTESAAIIIGVAKEKPQLTSLCGNKLEQTEADLSGQGLGAGDAMLLAYDLQKNSVLRKLKYFPISALHFISILYSLYSWHMPPSQAHFVTCFCSTEVELECVAHICLLLCAPSVSAL